MSQNLTETEILRVKHDSKFVTEPDFVATEEPLEIRLGFRENGKPNHRAISVTMRTPGNDFELAAGFLFTEGILKSPDQIENIRHCGRGFGANAETNTIRVDLRENVKIDFQKLERHFYTTSSCGVCGKSSIDALKTGAEQLKDFSSPQISAALIHETPEIARTSQSVFDATGGLHAAALFDRNGNLEIVREDVGRHNALDKLIGARFLETALPLGDKILLVSGRASFELVQKALMAQIPIMAAVGAPSSLAVELAREFGLTLLGFVRERRFNVYSGAERIKIDF